MEQVFEDSACRTLELVRGLKCFSDTTPTASIKGDCWPPYGEIITRYPLCGASKLYVYLDCMEGQSTLTFGLISPQEKPRRKDGEHLQLTGKLWAWNSEFRRIFNKPFDSRSNYGASSPIVQFYDNDIRSGNILCVYRDVKTNRIHFVINGKEGWVSFSSGAPDFCYGYVRLCSRGSDSNIQVTMVQEKAYFYSVIEPAHVLEQENINPWWMPVVGVGKTIHRVILSFLPGLNRRAKQLYQEPEITELHHYRMSEQHPRGICLLINNVPNMVSEEKQLTDLFKHLSFDVHVRRNLQMLQIYEVAQEFARKDHSEFDSFVVIIISVCGHDHEISGIDGKKAGLENVMSEFTATNCSSLQGKPKLFFVQRFTMTPAKVGDGSTEAHCYCTDKNVRPFSPCAILGGDGCPEEADFLLTCVTSPVNRAKRVPKSLFLQILVKVIGKYCHLDHLLDMLIKVNERMVEKQNGRPNGVMTVPDVPYLTHTLRAKVNLGSVPLHAVASITPDVTQQNRYEINKRPRGLCVIINNSKFHNKAMDRPGAEADERNLKNLFKDLSFKVIVERNLKKHEIEKVAGKYGAVDHRDFDAFVFILMSHGGDRDCILGVDGRETTVKNLMFEFQESKCPSLKNKPKVFIIQTCRGLRDDVSKRVMFSTGNINSQVAIVASTSAQMDNEPCDIALMSRDSTLPRSVFPQEADFVLAFATVPGYVSYRFSDGTFFIQALVEVIKEYHHRHHFLEMLTEVTKRVVERQSNMAAHPVQVPAPMHTMTKLLYL